MLKYFFTFLLAFLSHPLFAMEESKNSPASKFKLGFEFQEISHLCPWAVEMDDIQNKPLFGVSYRGESLWHVVIDTNDVEFVTVPFCSDLPDTTVALCLKSISFALRAMKEAYVNCDALQKTEVNKIKIKIQALKDKIKKFEGKSSKIEKKIEDLSREIDASEAERESFKEKEKELEVNRDLSLAVEAILGIIKNSNLIDNVDEKVKELFHKSLEGKELYSKKINENNDQLDFLSFNRKHFEDKLLQKKDKLTSLLIKRAKFEGKIEALDQTLMGLQAKSPLVHINDWFDMYSKDQVMTHTPGLELRRYDELEKVANYPLSFPNNRVDGWLPEFNPQVTIQHSLKWTIPLYFTLLGFETGCSPKKYFEDFIRALPNQKEYNKFSSQKANLSMELDITPIMGEVSDPLNGFLFLYALTLRRIYASVSPTNDDDASLKQTVSDYERNQQFDIKMYLPLMSRRSFSDMYKELDVKESFKDIFHERLKENNHLFLYDEIENNISKLNYGSQLCHNGRSVDLSNFAENIIEKEFLLKNYSSILFLLSKGIVTTTMLRHCTSQTIKAALEGYFGVLLDSVMTPCPRWQLGLEYNSLPVQEDESSGVTFGRAMNLHMKSVKWSHDALSPPWFLDSEDSMGKLSHTTNEGPDLTYGGAIVEVREIKGVTSFFRKIAKGFGLNFTLNNGMFLTSPDNFQEEALLLFSFLKIFHDKCGKGGEDYQELVKEVIRMSDFMSH